MAKKRNSFFEVVDDQIVSDFILTPLYLCTYKLRTLFDQCLFGLVEIISSKSQKKGRKSKIDLGTGELLNFLGIKLDIGGESLIENGTSNQRKSSITPILQLAILLRYFEKREGIAIELNAKDKFFEPEPNSIVRFVVKKPSIVDRQGKRPHFLNTSQWEDVLGQLRFEFRLEGEDHFAYVSKVLGKPVVATISFRKITAFGQRELYNLKYPQMVLARFMGDREGALFIDPICIWLEWKR